MALKKRTRGDGTYYWRFEVFKRRNPVTNKQEYYPTKNFERKKGWSDKKYDKEAEKAYAVYENDCKNGLVLSKEELKNREIQDEIERQKRKTLKEFIYEDFLPYKEKEVEATSFALYKRRIDKLEKIWDIKLPDISKKILHDFVNDLDKMYSRNTVKSIISLIKMTFDYAIKLELIERSPADGLSLPKLTKAEKAAIEGNPQYKRLTPQEYDLLMEYLETEPPIYRVLLRFMADSGARLGEAIALKWENIDLDTGEVNICDNIQRIWRSGYITKQPKNGYGRKIYLTNESLPEMIKWKQEQCPCSEWCFPSIRDYHKNISASSVQERFKLIGNRIGVDHFHPHMLRHTCASRWVEMGMPIQIVASRLGHKNMNTTTLVYSHSSNESDRAAAEKWNQLHDISG